MAKRETASTRSKSASKSNRNQAVHQQAQAASSAPVHSLGIDLGALGLIVCGIFFFISLFGDGTGLLGGGIRRVLFGLFGNGAYGVALVLVLFGVLILLEYIWSPRVFDYWMGALLWVGILLLLHMVSTSQGAGPAPESLKRYLPECYDWGKLQHGGGFFGALIMYPFVLLLGRVGTWLLVILWLGAVLLAWTGLSLRRVSHQISTQVTRTVENWHEAREENRRRQEVMTFKDMGWEANPGPQDKERQTVTHGLDMDFVVQEDDLPAPEPDAEDTPVDIAEVFSRELDARPDEPVQSPVPKPTKSQAKSKRVEVQEPESVPVSDVEAEGNIPSYVFPPLSLLEAGRNSRPEDAAGRARKLEETFQSFGIRAEVTSYNCGPAITQFEVHPAPGVKSASIVNLANDIALNLAAPSVRIEAPIPGKSAIGVEIPNKTTSTVKLRDVLESSEFSNHKSRVAFCLGRDIVGKNVVADIAKMPHLLIAGATGSGKSVCINSIIVSLLYKSTPQEVRMILIDPKVVELGVYNGIPHLLIPVVTDPKKAAGALNWAVAEMTRRYQLFAQMKTRNIAGYNELVEKPEDKLPSIVIVIDELADLMMVAPGDVEDAICRLAQLARAAGMYLIIATQRPSVDVITGVIKANILSRIAFQVSSQIDSRTILDMSGAEKLLGKGDMLFSLGGSKVQRVQGCFVPDDEVEDVVDFITQDMEETGYDSSIQEEIDRFETSGKGKGKAGSAAQTEDSTDGGRSLDPLLREVVDTLYDQQQLSISMVQRKMGVGYARAARIVDQLEALGVVAEGSGAKPRQFLKPRQEIYEILDMNEGEGDS